MSLQHFYVVSIGLIVLAAIALVAGLITLAIGVVGWKKPSSGKARLRGYGLVAFAIASVVTAGNLFRFIEDPTELTEEHYRYARKQMDRRMTENSMLRQGDDAPEFTIETMNGESLTTSAFKNTILLVNFFRTDCGPCLQEMPVLQELWEEYGSRNDFRMITISRGESLESVASFMAANELTLPIGIDADSSIYKQYASEGIPRNYLVGRDGTITFQSLGFRRNKIYDGDAEIIRKAVANALAEDQSVN